MFFNIVGEHSNKSGLNINTKKTKFINVTCKPYAFSKFNSTFSDLQIKRFNGINTLEREEEMNIRHGNKMAKKF